MEGQYPKYIVLVWEEHRWKVCNWTAEKREAIRRAKTEDAEIVVAVEISNIVYEKRS
jgi:hypothetical protein